MFNELPPLLSLLTRSGSSIRLNYYVLLLASTNNKTYPRLLFSDSDTRHSTPCDTTCTMRAARRWRQNENHTPRGLSPSTSKVMP